MNCQEVMELMQRYIDDDLDQLETSLMMDHVGQCPDCAAMLVRLQKLSSDLEQLPRVVPKMSLVDAILPELERLDAGGLAGSTLDRGDDLKEEPSVSRSSRPNRRLFRNVSGVVAAGIVAGFLLFGQPDKWFLPGGSSQQDSAAQSPAVAARNAAPAEPESSMLRTMEEGTTVSPTAKQKDSVEVSDQLGDALPLTGESNEFTIQGAPEDKSKSMSSGGSDGLESSEIGEGSLPMSFSSIPAERSDSPDGKWIAIAAEGAGTFQIYKTEDHSEWFSSEPIDGKISLFSWNENSSILYFTVTDSEHHQTEWQFDTVTAKQSLR